MANYNLTNQDIKDTFQQLAQVSGSIEGGITGSGVTDGVGNRVTNLHVTASDALNSNTSISASHAVQADSALTATSASHAQNADNAISSSYALTASFAENVIPMDTGSFLITASNVDATITYTKGDGSTFTNIINNVAFSTEAEDLVITVKNTSGVTLAKGTAVHAVGVTGQNVDVIAASNDSAATMPAIGLLSQEIANNASGTCIIQGRETGINTTGLSAGDSVYVDLAGALTATKPTGSALIQNIGTAAKINGLDGEIIIQGSGRVNDLPNITTDYVWKGDSNGVPQAVPVSGLAITSASYAVSASYALSASVEIIKEVSSSYADVSGRVAFDPNISSTGVYNYPFVKSVSGDYADLGDTTAYKLQQDNVRGEIITSGSTLVVGAGGGDLKVTGSSNIEIQAGDINFKDGNVSILTNGGNVLTNNGANTAVQGTTNVDIRDAGTIFMRTGQNAVGGIQLAGAQVKVLGDSSTSASLRVDGDTALGNGALALEVKSTITSQSVDIQGGTRLSGSLRSIGGQIQLGDTGSGNSIDLPVNGTAVVKGSTDFFNGAIYFGDQINVGGSFSTSGGGSSITIQDGTNVQISADMNLSASKQLIGTASYAVFAENVGGSITNAATASYVNPLTQSVDINGGLTVTGSVNTSTSIISNGGSIQALGGGGITVGNSGFAQQYPSMNVYTNSGSYAGQIYGSHRITDLSGNGDVGILALSTFNAGDPGRIAFETQFNSDVVWWISENKNNFHVEKPLRAKAGAQVTGSLDVTGSLSLNGNPVGAAFPYVGNAVITGSFIVSGSGLSSGEDVFVLGAPRGGGNSLQGVIRSTVDDGLHFFGNKQFGAGANTFGGGNNSFESEVQIGNAGSPVPLKFFNNSPISASGTLPISGNVDIDGILSLPGITNVSASIAAGGGSGSPAFPFTGSAGISGSLLVNTGNLFGDAAQFTGSIGVTGAVEANNFNATNGAVNLASFTTPAQNRITGYGNYSGSTVVNNYLAFLDASGTYPGPPPALYGCYSNAVAGNTAGDPFALIAGGAVAGEQFNWGIMLDQTGDIKTLKKMSIRQGADISGSLVVTGSQQLTGNLTQVGSITTTGGVSTGTSAAPVQFPSSLLYLDTEGFGSGYSGYQIINQRSGSTALAGQLEMSTFSGLDGSNPIFGNKFNNNYLWWTSENYPEFNVARKLVAEQGMDLSGSIGINGSFTGSLNLNGAINATGNITGQNITANQITGSSLQVNGIIDADNVNIGSTTSATQFGNRINYYDSEKNTGNLYQALQFVNNASGSSKFSSQMEITTFSGLDSTGGTNQPVFRLRGGGDNGVNGNTIIWSSYDKPQAHFAKDSLFQSNVEVTGSLKYEGTTTGKQRTLSISAGTASLDPSTGDYFTLTLASGTDTVVDVGYSDAGRGTTFILEVKPSSPAGGTISFANAKFPGGVAPVASSGTDLYTFVSINGADSYGTQTANFI